MKVKILRAFYYGGRVYKKGDEAEIINDTALTLAKCGYVEKVETAKAKKAEEPEIMPEEVIETAIADKPEKKTRKKKSGSKKK